MPSKIQQFGAKFTQLFGATTESIRIENPEMGQGCTVNIDTKKISIVHVQNHKPTRILYYFQTESGMINDRPMTPADVRKTGLFLEKFISDLEKEHIELTVKKRGD